MRTVVEPAELTGAIRAARSEAGAAFGDAAVYLERRITRPRHVEVQLLADQHGTVLPFVERECSIQRRHQKVVEETPSLAVSPATRAAMAPPQRPSRAGRLYQRRHHRVPPRRRRAVLLPGDEYPAPGRAPDYGDRLRCDLVRCQIRIARGERLDLDPARVLTPTGHAIECRVYAEDPDNNFLPSPGRIQQLRVPTGPGIRDDSGATQAWTCRSSMTR